MQWKYKHSCVAFLVHIVPLKPQYATKQQPSRLLELDSLSEPVIVERWPRVGGPAVETGYKDPICHRLPWWILPQDSLSFLGTDWSSPGAPALTGGAQQALNAAINLHHCRFESEQGVCDRRYVSGNEVWVSGSTLCVYFYYQHYTAEKVSEPPSLKKKTTYFIWWFPSEQCYNPLLKYIKYDLQVYTSIHLF